MGYFHPLAFHPTVTDGQHCREHRRLPVARVPITGVFGEGSGEALFAKRASPVAPHYQRFPGAAIGLAGEGIARAMSIAAFTSARASRVLPILARAMPRLL